MAGHSKWANIKHRKGKMDAVKGKLTTKIGREITVAVRLGGADPTGNMRLKLALQKAKGNNIPKDNVHRAIQKGQGSLDGAQYEEITYEGYGPGGVAVTVEVMTDNRNRTAADVRHLFVKYGGNLGETGCVAWIFKKKATFIIDKTAVTEEDLMLLVLDAGAEDIRTEEEQYEIIADPDDFEKIQQALETNRITMLVAEISMIHDTTITLCGDEAIKMVKLIDALEDHDDVQEVYTNVALPDDMMI